MMKNNLTLLLFLLTFLVSCKNSDDDTALLNYPEGIELVDVDSENDCSLPACSSDRIVRLKAEDVQGTIIENDSGEYIVRYSYPIDTQITFYFCNLPEDFKINNLEVEFDGEAIDACGARPFLGFGGEQVYSLRLQSIREL